MPKESTLLTWSITRLLVASLWCLCSVWPYPIISHCHIIFNNPPDFLVPWLSRTSPYVLPPWIRIKTYHSFPLLVQNPVHPCHLNPHSSALFPSTSLISPALPSSRLHSFVQLRTFPPTLVRGSWPSSEVSKLPGSHLLFQYLWIFLILFSQDLAAPLSLSPLCSYLEGILSACDLYPSILVPPVVMVFSAVGDTSIPYRSRLITAVQCFALPSTFALHSLSRWCISKWIL